VLTVVLDAGVLSATTVFRIVQLAAGQPLQTQGVDTSLGEIDASLLLIEWDRTRLNGLPFTWP